MAESCKISHKLRIHAAEPRHDAKPVELQAGDAAAAPIQAEGAPPAAVKVVRRHLAESRMRLATKSGSIQSKWAQLEKVSDWAQISFVGACGNPAINILPPIALHMALYKSYT